MATLKTGTTIGGSVAWHAGNDGAGSGLDADMVDGKHAERLRPVVAPTPPSAPRVGEIWVDSDDTLFTQDSWQYPTLINGWGNYAPSWSQARYARLMGGVCIMEGLIAGGGNWAAALVLPVGFRPSHYFLQASTHNANQAATVYVYPTGEVVCGWSTAGDNGWCSIHALWYVEG